MIIAVVQVFFWIKSYVQPKKPLTELLSENSENVSEDQFFDMNAGRGRGRGLSQPKSPGSSGAHPRRYVGRGRSRLMQSCQQNPTTSEAVMNFTGVSAAVNSPESVPSNPTHSHASNDLYANDESSSLVKHKRSATHNQQIDWKSMQLGDTAAVPETEAVPGLDELRRRMAKLLKQNPKNQKEKGVIKLLHDWLVTTTDPYSDVLTMISGCGVEAREPKRLTLPFLIAKEFNRWIASKSSLHSFLTKDVQLRALDVATCRRRQVFDEFFQFLCQAYSLKDVRDSAIGLCKDLLYRRKVKDAAIIIGLLDLHTEFDFEADLFIPLLLEDKINVVESMVHNNAELQQRLVKFLDKISNKSFDLSTLIKTEDGKAPMVIKTHFNHRSVKKLGTRLMKKYNAESVCPYLQHSQAMGFVRHLIYRFYREGDLDRTNWRELLTAAIKEDKNMQVDLVAQLTPYDVAEAAFWAEQFQLTADEIPGEVASYVPPVYDDSEDWETEILPPPPPAYYSLKLPMSSVHMINTASALEWAVDTMEQSGDPIGVDAEWKPIFQSGQETKLALLQMAIWSDVFIIDMITLGTVPDLSWESLVDKIFMSASIIKLGYGFREDVRMLRKAIPIWGDRQIVSLIDLCALQAAVNQKQGPVEMGSANSKGLSECVRQLLGGQSLSKKEQVSDWEKRPLRDSQLEYAALDAYCLLEIYLQLKPLAEMYTIDLFTSKDEPKKVKKPKTKGKAKKPTSAEVFGSTHSLPADVTPSSVKFVVSNMLQGLGKQLRLLGIDVHIISDETGDDHDDAARIALTQQRYILTAGLAYQRLQALARPDTCFCVDTDLTARQQALAIIKHFNMTVTKKDIFSRCQTCNNGEYLIIDSSSMSYMFERYKPVLPPSADTLSKLKAATGYNQETISLNNGVLLQLDPVSEKILKSVEMFFICAKCGKVFWEGSHYDRVHKHFENILFIQEDVSENIPSIQEEDVSENIPFIQEDVSENIPFIIEEDDSEDEEFMFN